MKIDMPNTHKRKIDLAELGEGTRVHFWYVLWCEDAHASALAWPQEWARVRASSYSRSLQDVDMDMPPSIKETLKLR